MLHVVWGSTKDKPVSSRRLAELLSSDKSITGYLYIGYPIIGSPLGPVRLDALLLSPTKGLVAFDLVEGLEVGDYNARQDEIASMLDVRLKPHPGLKRGRALRFDVNVLTFAPAKHQLPDTIPPYFLANEESLAAQIGTFKWSADEETFINLVAAIQVVTSIRAGRQRRDPKDRDSRGARLKRVEESVANLDQHQSQAVIETVEGVQRIRGLAGSGKTIILALKVAYLHAQNPDWSVAVTFNTRSLKDQFRRLINNFTIEQTGDEPDWDRIEILNAWGGPGDRDRDGLYHRFCREHNVAYSDFSTAQRLYGEGKEFEGACASALKEAKELVPAFDIILVDEAQDLPAAFLRLCYAFLREPKRFVYAYDELQSLTSNSVPPPEELFGTGPDGKPLVRLGVEDALGPRQDVILEKCYRNSRPILATAHALGFGIYRKKGLVQFFEEDSLWMDVGYSVLSGRLEGGMPVTLARTAETSPAFLEDHSPTDDLIQFIALKDAKEQEAWIVDAIKANIEKEELRPDDIIVINPDPISTRRAVASIRSALFELGINSELAGVSTSADIFSKTGSVTFTGIFRAKGNEAGMVYVVNANDCFSGFDNAHLALVRNRLFTAITRSKAWVRVLGWGRGMEALCEEWEELRNRNFELQFTYPTEDEKHKLKLIHRDVQRRGQRRQSRLEQRAGELLAAVERGDVDPDVLIQKLNELKARNLKQ